MSNLRLGKVFVALVVLSLIGPLTARATPLEEPTPDGSFRPLRTDYIQTWYIYNDNQIDGILNPGDNLVDTFENWWTPASSHSQHNYSRDGGPGLTYALDSDVNSNPINYASHNSSGNEDFWLKTTKNAINFYMSYSQFDNNDWKGGYTYSADPTIQTIVSERHEDRNGWVLGWVIHSEEADNSNPQTLAGFVDMDIFIHNGRGLNPNPDGSIDVAGFGKSYSNPQVSMSNDISSKAIDASVSIPALGPGGERYHPPQFDDATGTYSWAANDTRMNYNGLNAADLNDIVNSMEVREYDAASLGAADVIWDNRTPGIIEATLTDHAGNPYTYDDAILDDSLYHDGASDGGVIAGLAGETDYNKQDNNWGDQQVIRIDISEETLLMLADPNLGGNIDKIVFWDFGASTPGGAGTQQTNPTPIIFYIDLAQTVAHGQIFWDDGAGGRIYFPENRIYIAQVDIVPEPGSLALVALGTVAMLVRKRRTAMR